MEQLEGLETANTLKGIFQKKLGLKLQTIDHCYEQEEDREGRKGLDRLVIIDRKTMIVIERNKEMTGGIIIIRMGTHKETIEKIIKIDNSIMTNKSSKETIQKGKIDQMIIIEKKGNNKADNNKT